MVVWRSASSVELESTASEGDEQTDGTQTADDTSPRQLPTRRVVITMAGMMRAMFLGSFDQTIVGSAVPRIVSDLGGFNHYTWITIPYIIAFTVTVPIVGRLSDMYGGKWFYTAGIAIFIGGSLLCGFSVPLGVVVIGLFGLFLPHLRPASLKRKIDYCGLATLILSVVPACKLLPRRPCPYGP